MKGVGELNLSIFMKIHIPGGGGKSYLIPLGLNDLSFSQFTYNRFWFAIIITTHNLDEYLEVWLIL